MSTMYSKAFDHIRPIEDDTDYTYADPELDENLLHRRGPRSRGSAFKIKNPGSVNLHTGRMGQVQSSTGMGFTQNLSDHGYSMPHQRSAEYFHDLDEEGLQRIAVGHTEEDSDAYSYAYSKDVAQEPAVRRRPPPAQRSVSLDEDYSQPPDQLSQSSDRTSSQDYTEPYRSQGNVIKKPSVSSIVPHDPGGIYELAKNVDQSEDTPQLTGDTYSHLESVTKSIDSVKLDPDSHLTYGYDHLDTWSSRQKPLDSIDSNESHYHSAETSPMQKRRVSDEVFASPRNKMAGAVYQDIPSNYEEPWDSEESQKMFNRVLNRAEKKHERRQSVEKGARGAGNQTEGSVKGSSTECANELKHPSHNVPKTSPRIVPESTYEMAWERSNQRKHSDSSSSAKKNSVSRPLPHGTIPSNYEDAWDLPIKQKEFEEKLEKARKERFSKGQIREEGDEEVFTKMAEISRQSSDRKSPCFSARKSDVVPPSPTRVKHSDHAARSDSCRSLGALAEKIDKTLPLSEQNFYHGPLKRSEAERILVVFKEGSYLIRRSETSKKDYSLTLKGWNNLPMHMKITSKPDGSYVLGENSPPFRTIPEMVDYYTTHELPVQNAQRICLLYPIPC